MELTGKMIAFVGDSITAGVGVSDIDYCRYDRILKRECGLQEALNYSISGTRLAYQQHASTDPGRDRYFCSRICDIRRDAEIVVVFGGVNDYVHGDAPVGKMGDTTPDTFYGAVFYLMNTLKNTYHFPTVVFMTPARCFVGITPDTEPYPKTVGAENAEPLPVYVDAIVKSGMAMQIPVLNLYHDLGVNPSDRKDREAYTVDGIHLNDAGHRLLAQKLKSFLMNL